MNNLCQYGNAVRQLSNNFPDIQNPQTLQPFVIHHRPLPVVCNFALAHCRAIACYGSQLPFAERTICSHQNHMTPSMYQCYLAIIWLLFVYYLPAICCIVYVCCRAIACYGSRLPFKRQTLCSKRTILFPSIPLFMLIINS